MGTKTDNKKINQYLKMFRANTNKYLREIDLNFFTEKLYKTLPKTLSEQTDNLFRNLNTTIFSRRSITYLLPSFLLLITINYLAISVVYILFINVINVKFWLKWLLFIFSFSTYPIYSCLKISLYKWYIFSCSLGTSYCFFRKFTSLWL